VEKVAYVQGYPEYGNSRFFPFTKAYGLWRTAILKEVSSYRIFIRGDKGYN
jgi:hypothetical protein